VNVQAMVFGNMGTIAPPASASRGTRHGGEGVLRRVSDNAQGEDVVAGIRTRTRSAT